MKKSMLIVIAALGMTNLFADVFGVKRVDDVVVVNRNNNLNVRTESVFDDDLKKDVVQINYRIDGEMKERIHFDVLFPALDGMEWTRIDEVRLRVRGGLGYVSVSVIDKDGEDFRFKKPTMLSDSGAWNVSMSSYRDWSDRACHHGIPRASKMKANRVGDAPLTIGSARVVIYPQHLKLQPGLQGTQTEKLVMSKDAELRIAEIEVAGVRIGEKKPVVVKASALQVSFDEIGTVVPLDEGNKDVLVCKVKNPGSEKADVELDVKGKLLLSAKKEQTFKATLALAGGEEMSVKLPFKFGERGFYDVRATVRENGRESVGKTFVNVWRTMGNSYDDDRPIFFATQAGLDLFNDRFGIYREQDYRTMQRAGVKMLRFVLRWKAMQPEKDGEINWTLYDHIIERLTAHGITPYLMISNAPDWSANPEVVKTKPKFVMACAPDNDEFAKFCMKVVKRYGKFTKYFQVWNEPYAHHYYWGGNEKTYADMLRKAYPAIKAADSNAVVCAGAAWKEVLRTAYGSYDYWPFHCHGNAEELYSLIQGYRKELRAGETTRKLWCDETGFATDPRKDGSEVDKASVIMQKGIVCRGEGLSVHVWFGYRHSPNGPTNPRDNFLAVDEKNRCRPVVTAHNTMVRMIHGADAVDSLYKKGIGAAYVFKQGGRKVLAFWRTDRPQGQVLKVKFAGDVKGTRVNMFGTEEPFATNGGEVSFIMTHEVQYLAFDGDVKGMDIVSFVDVPYQTICAETDKEITIVGKVTNPFASNMACEFTFAGCEGWKSENGKIKLNLKSGETKELRIKYLAHGNVPKVSYPSFVCDVAAHGIRFTGELKFMSSMKVMREWTHYGRLASEKFVTNLRTGDVDADLFWQGENDLSAEVSAKCEPDGLRLRVRVEDDRHSQKHEGFGIFDGDSLQVQIIGADLVKHQFGIALTDAGNRTFGEYRGKLSKTPEYSVVRKGTQTEYEALIPWGEVGLKGVAGETFDLSCLVNDNDGRFRKVILEWGGGIHGMKSGPMNPMMINIPD